MRLYAGSSTGFVAESANGPIPDNMVIVSTCGERTCIEPTHLALSKPGRYAGQKDARGKYAREPVSR